MRTLARDQLRPDRADLVDVAFGVVLAVLGVIGFRTVFSGGEELTVGVASVLVGAALGYLLAKVRASLLGSTAIAIVVFFVLGGPVALRHRAIAGVIPSPSAITALADGTVNGWKQLLTSLPPAGDAGDLLAVIYLSGFVGGLLTVALAIRYPRRAVCALPPTVVLGVSVLMGTKRPASLLLQGMVFAALTLAWVAIRHERARSITRAAASRSRLATAGALLAVSALCGVVIGPRLPGAQTEDRFVLRDEVEPPFDPLTEPSPLVTYRNFTNQDVRDDPILTATGLPDGARIRIASMDAYSGTVWQATGDGSLLAGEYQRVGTEIPADGRGEEAEVEIEVRKAQGVWVPLAGDVTGVRFEGERARVLDDELRLSVETDTAAVPGELRAGDRYRFTAEFTDPPDAAQLADAELDDRFERQDADDVPPEFVSRGAEWARDQPTAVAEMLAIAEGLQTEGAYTDGGEEANPVSPPGHSLRRLLDFIDIEQPFGNGEQFAAAQGLLARSRGVPVRVVMGFVNESDQERVTFRGEDIEAWIEVPVQGYGWVAIDGTPPEDQLPDPQKQPRSKTENPEPQPPPPTTIPPPTSIPEDLKPEDPDEEERDQAEGGIPAWLAAAAVAVGAPVAVLGATAGIVVLLKRRRRRRRRTHGSPSDRVAGSFTELVDYARDVGEPVPPRSTRRELASVLTGAGVAPLADRADTAVFGAVDPTEPDVDGAWTASDEARAAMAAELDRTARLRAAVNPTSLRADR